MAIIRGTDFEGETIVVHFGGPVASIDAYTFANSLIGFADLARAISASVDPGQEIEIVLEAYGQGSFRALVRRLRKEYGGILSRGIEAVFWGIVATTIYEATIKSDSRPIVIVNSDEVIIQHGNDQLIVPRKIYDAAENAKKSPAITDGLHRTFEPLAADKKVTDFGLTTSIADPEPKLRIPRIDFPIASLPQATRDEADVRPRREKARLVILKAWLNPKHKKHKWSFEWNGVPLSAPIADTEFLSKLYHREYVLGAGDALDVEIMFRQQYHPALGIYVNDQNSFVINRVERVVGQD
jgi:hypothetical protein